MQQRTRNAIVAWVLPLQLLAACSVMVDPEALLIRCEFDPTTHDRDPCQTLAQQCVDGVCRACDALELCNERDDDCDGEIDEGDPCPIVAPPCLDGVCGACDSDARELCNGRDDDCDGVIDEGHDTDQDGFTWCGGGRVEIADCVDSDKSIHPGEEGVAERAPVEVCDGKDNDCDARVDEDRECDRMKNCADTPCPDNQECDMSSGVCIVPRPVGSGCTNDLDCEGGFCLRPGAFDLPINLTDNRCATACCSSSDCDEGSSCVISRSGARACLPANIVGGGSRTDGERCVRDADCASALCARNLCRSRCFNAEACPKDTCALSLGSANEPRTFLCSEPGGRGFSGESCLAGCRTNHCTEELVCATPCARDSDCAVNAACKFVDVWSALLGQVSEISICASRTSDTAPVETIEQLCCTNTDCGANLLCAPNLTRPMTWHMSCRAK